MKLRFIVLLSVVILLLVCLIAIYIHSVPKGKQSSILPYRPAQMACWPWKNAKTDNPYPGVKHWVERSSSDGTVIDLFDFNFQQNRSLQLEMYDQDMDDAVPFDDHVVFRKNGVGQVTRHLNETGRGKVIAAWNGLFFQYAGDIARHVAPVVINGKALYNVGTVRWTVGVKYENGKPVFKVILLPKFKVLSGEFNYASEGASCLIYNGKPLQLQPFPKLGEDPFPSSKIPSEGEAGFVRKVDHIRTSRTSFAWSKDNQHFYLLIVKEPDAEGASISAFRNGIPAYGGWTVADEQRFWKQFGAWCAVNLDGGDVTQLSAIRSDGKYDIVPPRWSSNSMRLTFKPDFKSAPTGGALMYFYIRDAKMRH